MINCAPIELSPNLAAILAEAHLSGSEPRFQSVRGGTQGNLKETNIKAVLRLKRAILERFEGMRFSGIWSTALQKDGYHVPHRHPKGEISGVVYVSVPHNVSGHFEYWINDSVSKFFIPTEGTILTFPSTMVHAVTRYDGEIQRLAVGFDLVRNG